MKKKTPPPKKVKAETTDVMPEAAQAAAPFTSAGTVKEPASCGLRYAGETSEYRRPSSPREKLAQELDALIRREAFTAQTLQQLAERHQSEKEHLINTQAEIKLLRWQLANG